MDIADSFTEHRPSAIGGSVVGVPPPAPDPSAAPVVGAPGRAAVRRRTVDRGAADVPPEGGPGQQFRFNCRPRILPRAPTPPNRLAEVATTAGAGGRVRRTNEALDARTLGMRRAPSTLHEASGWARFRGWTARTGCGPQKRPSQPVVRPAVNVLVACGGRSLSCSFRGVSGECGWPEADRPPTRSNGRVACSAPTVGDAPDPEQHCAPPAYRRDPRYTATKKSWPRANVRHRFPGLRGRPR